MTPRPPIPGVCGSARAAMRDAAMVCAPHAGTGRDWPGAMYDRAVDENTTHQVLVVARNLRWLTGEGAQ